MRIAIVLHGGFVGAATLQRWCPEASRRARARWMREYRRVQRRGGLRVRWRDVGRVWAMDISEPPQPIDGGYRYVVHVRDLASQYYLAALPVRRATARVVCDLLRALCATCAAPRVLKVDNGSAFGSGDLQQWADQMATLLLYSPPTYPPYNGSIEASIGAISARAHEVAAANGHPEYWTTDDIATARAAANLTIRPWRRPPCTPTDAWRGATRITSTERRRFCARYQRELRALRAAPGETTRLATRGYRRTAIVRTLDVLGYVSIRRRAELVH